MTYPNPLIAGFHPDPSIIRDGDDYYLVNSSFEFLPGIPVHHSRDLISWELIGHVVTRESQANLEGVFTNGGIWAPTIRKHDDMFFVTVKIAGKFGEPAGMHIFTAEHPSGPWSDGVKVLGIEGIDPDLCWDENGDCWMAFSGLNFSTGKPVHHGIQVAKIDPHKGELLSEVIDLWGGAGLMFPEGPHLYKIGDFWYLVAAEGGTDRGHAVTIARGLSLLGPWESAPGNPILTARSEFHSVQNVGHGDLVQTPDGGWAMVCLGVRVYGLSSGFSPLGRETFITPVSWEEGWPVCTRIEANDLSIPSGVDLDFQSLQALDESWIGLRRHPRDVTKLTSDGLVLGGRGRDMSHLEADALCRRQAFVKGLVTTRLTTSGVAGLSVRYNEAFHYDIELQPGRVVARFAVNTVVHEVVSEVADVSTLYIDFKDRPGGFSIGGNAPDYIELGYQDSKNHRVEVATFDGRFLSQETNSSFTGRVLALYSVSGETRFLNYKEDPEVPKASTMENNFSEAI